VPASPPPIPLLLLVLVELADVLVELVDVLLLVDVPLELVEVLELLELVDVLELLELVDVLELFEPVDVLVELADVLVPVEVVDDVAPPAEVIAVALVEELPPHAPPSAEASDAVRLPRKTVRDRMPSSCVIPERSATSPRARHVEFVLCSRGSCGRRRDTISSTMEVAMGDPSKPKGPPREGKTQAFRLKMDGWMEEILKQDLDPDAAPEEPNKDEQAPPPAPAPAPAPPKP
jgi:hypothetical protein